MKTKSTPLPTESERPTNPMTVSWSTHDGREHEEPANKTLLDRELYLAKQSRTGNRYPRQKNYHGLNWFASTGTHVWYESLMERQALLWLDFTSDIVAIAAQPMRMDFPDGTSHFPDYIALHADHSQVVYNVKPQKFISAKVQKQFDNTTQLCKTVGWSHEVISEFNPAVIANIEWLANYRQPAFTPTEETRVRLLAALDAPLPLAAAAAAVADQRGVASPATVYHLLWSGDLVADLTVPLGSDALVRKAN